MQGESKHRSGYPFPLQEECLKSSPRREMLHSLSEGYSQRIGPAQWDQIPEQEFVEARMVIASLQR